MNERSPNRRHTQAFKDQVCGDIRTGVIGRREAQQRYNLSDNLIHQWLARFDLAKLAAASTHVEAIRAEYEHKISALERKVGQLVMALEGRPTGQIVAAQRSSSSLKTGKPKGEI